MIWTGVMGYLLLTSATPKSSTWWFEGADKVAHFTLFSIWTFLLYGALSKGPEDRSSLWKIVIAAVLFGLSTEIVQVYVPRRSGDEKDFLADMVGACLGLLVAYFLKKRLDRKVKSFD